MRNVKSEQRQAQPLVAPTAHESEYGAIHNQRLALIRSYNVWYAFGHAMAFACFWALLYLSLTLSSRPMLLAAAVAGSAIVFFAYRIVLSIDRGVVALYPRIVFLELMLDYDFYRDYLRRRPRGDTERSFIERCERLETSVPAELWDQVYSQFSDNDFPGDRRITAQFKSAAWLAVALYWVIVALILLPQYFPWI